MAEALLYSQLLLQPNYCLNSRLQRVPCLVGLFGGSLRTFSHNTCTWYAKAWSSGTVRCGSVLMQHQILCAESFPHSLSPSLCYLRGGKCRWGVRGEGGGFAPYMRARAPACRVMLSSPLDLLMDGSGLCRALEALHLKLCRWPIPTRLV